MHFHHMVSSQEQLLDLVEEFYAHILLQDDEAIVTTDDGEDLPTLCVRHDHYTNTISKLKVFQCFKESLFEFVRGHYLMKLLTAGSCHAFISSLEEFYKNSKVRINYLLPSSQCTHTMQELLMLAHVLCGDLDGCSIRYSLLQASLVQAVPQWSSQAQFSAFITSLYPFLGVC